MTSATTDWEFVFDGVVAFLRSPWWNLPIVTFIEKNCLVFEPGDENELVHTQIHKEYGKLVEDLLTSYLNDLGITEEQFVRVCEVGSNDSSPQTNRVWAGEDFELFKRMMIQKNVDMELQVLHMIQQRNGVVPAIFDSENAAKKKSKSKSSHRADDEQLLKEVMRLSQSEYEKEKAREKDIERMEKSMALSKSESERLHDLAERELNELERMVTLSLRLEKRRENDKKEAATEGDKKKPKASPDSKTKSSSQRSKGSSSPSTTGKHPPKPSKDTSKSDTTQSKQSESKQSVSKQKTEKSSKPESTSPSPSKKTGTSSKPSPPQKSEPKAEKQKPDSKPVENKTPKSQPATEKAQAPPTKPSSSSSTNQTPLIKPDLTPSQAANNWLLSAKAETAVTTGQNSAGSKGAEFSKDDEMQRAMHMRRLREQLQELKKQERVKHLQTFESEQTVKRPMSSRAAQRRVAQGTVVDSARRGAEGAEAEKTAKSETEKQKEEKVLAMRRALVARLKKEVINNNDC